MSPFKKFVVALFVVFLHYSSQIAARGVETNRYCDLWGLVDVVAILLGMTLLALLVLGMDLLLLRWSSGTARRLFNHLFLVALVSGVLAMFPRFSIDHPNVTHLIWLGVMAGIGYSFGSRAVKPVRWAANLCLIFSPVVLIVFAQMATWSTWNQTVEERPAPAATQSGPGTPVFVFVFDEWSFQRSTEGGQLRPLFGNLRQLCRQAVVFREARSPYHSTEQSLPRMIFQTDGQFVVRDGDVLCEEGGRAVSARTLPSVFHQCRNHGYTSSVLGFYLPYRHIVGDQVDYCRVVGPSLCDVPLPAKLFVRACENLQYLSDPIGRRLRVPLLAPICSRRRYDQFQACRAEMDGILRSAGKRSFAFFHVPLPHPPFVFGADGSYHGTDVEMNDPEDYERHLHYLDAVIGQIVDTLRATGQFDDALIIMTSDHSWRAEPDPANREGADWNRRVPLIIKLPGQQSSVVIDDELCTNQLGPLFESVFSGQRDPQRLMALIRRISGPSDASVVPASAE